MSNNITSDKGSIWRKWDLHLHTPYTFLNKYSCTDEEFINKVISGQLSCIGLTNYFKFDENIEPFHTLKQLKQLRDNIAHGKP